MSFRSFKGMLAAFALSGAAHAALAADSPAQKTPYAMRGVVLGIDLEGFKAIPVPVEDNYDPGSPECDEQADGAATCKWVSNFKGSPTVGGQMYISLGDGGGYPEFDFVSDERGVKRLVEIDVRSNMAQWEKLTSAYTLKFGPPTVTHSTLQNGYGAQFTGETDRWSNGLSTITIEAHCGKIELVCITYKHTGLAAYIAARDRARNGDPAARL